MSDFSASNKSAPRRLANFRIVGAAPLCNDSSVAVTKEERPAPRDRGRPETAEDFLSGGTTVKAQVCLARPPPAPPRCSCLLGSRPSLPFREGDRLGSYCRFRSRSVILLADETFDSRALLQILVGPTRHRLSCSWHRTIVARNVARTSPSCLVIQNNDA
jgi:hypothetical protein